MSWLLSVGLYEHWGACIFLNYGFLRVYALIMELLDHTVVLFLVVKGASILFSIVAGSIYISTYSASIVVV